MNATAQKYYAMEGRQKVNYIKHRETVAELMDEIEDFNPSHIALYEAIFRVWNKTAFKKKFDVYRDELMPMAKIKGIATYHRIIDDLVEKGFIIYYSNRSRFVASTIEVVRFDDIHELGSSSKTEPLNEPLEEENEGSSSVSSSISCSVSSSKNELYHKHHKLHKPINKEKETPLPPLGSDSKEGREEVFELKPLPAEKEKRKKVAPKKEKCEVVMPWDEPEFLEQWQVWKDYKKEQHRFTYKHVSEQAALTNLTKLSNGDMYTAIQIIHQSIASGWKGFFELKNKQTNGKQSTAKFETDLSAWFARKERK